MKSPSKADLIEHIVKSLIKNKTKAQRQFMNGSGLQYFIIDNLLPSKWCQEINRSFPETSKMMLKKSLREDKFVGVQLEKYKTLIEEILYAFQNKTVISHIEEICGLKALVADEYLYAGGISSMKRGQFLKPHLDNSHDKDRNRWRVLNLLYYTTPDWKLEFGGNLEVWPKGLKSTRETVVSKFNRLVVMATDQKSWHSVSPVLINSTRNCVSNYYFSDIPIKSSDTFHVTLFRAWPHQKLSNMVLKLDGSLRMAIRRLFPKGIVKNPHVYNKKTSDKN